MMRARLERLTVDWHRKLSALFWAIIIVQYIDWLSNQEFNGVYWLEPTIWSAHASLFTVLAVELLLHAKRFIRILLQLAALLVVHMAGFGYDPVWFVPDSAASLFYLIELNTAQFMPYFLFGLGTAFVFILISTWSKTKGRILFVVAVSVILFAVIDSFSRVFYFSNQVAIMIFCGLMLMVIQHFREFKEKHPQSWEHMKEYPAAIAVPIVLFAAVVVLSGMLAPHARPLLKDPYTIWKNWRGEQVAQLGKGFNASTPIQLGNSESGYSRQDSELGGGFDFDYSSVMRINTSHRSYWRGEVRSIYNGRGWEPGASELGSLLEPIRPETKLSMENSRLDLSKLETEEVRYSVSRISPDSYPVLFGAFAWSEITSIDGQSEQLRHARWAPLQQTVRWMEEEVVEYPMFYSGVSEVPLIDEDGIRQAGVQLPEDLMAEYTQLPDTVPQRVIDLALDVTGEATNPYDKVKLLEQYLRSEYGYNNKPDTSTLADATDFVDYFLFESREGYCDYFSTAMVVMARSLDIPARWVKGYTAGAYDMENILGPMIDEMLEMNLNGEGSYTIRNADAHSWVEIYFAGYGWIPFEPTANFSLPVLHASEHTDLPELPLPELESVEPTGGGEGNTGGTRLKLIIAAIGGLIIALAAWALWRTNRLRSLFTFVRRKPMDEVEYRAKIVTEFDRFLRYARRKGFSHQESDTVRETVEMWTKRSKWLKDDMQILLDLFEKAKYSGAPIGEAELESTRNVIVKLRAAIK